MNVWGIHNDTFTSELLDDEFVSIGWDALGDLRAIPDGREGLKRELARLNPSAKPRSIAGQAGVLLRFRDEIAVGDLVVSPYSLNGTINLGVVLSDYYFAPGADKHRNRRDVEWKKQELPRAAFSRGALFEIGSLLTVFGVRNHATEYRAALESGPEESLDQMVSYAEKAAESQAAEAVESEFEPRASRVESFTRDFVMERIREDITHREFESFVAAVLRAAGYNARETPYSSDGGVDVIAHRDILGVEPPQIKVQVKHQAATIGAPEVQKLVGATGERELSVFVTLGNYSKDAIAMERQRPGLRLLSGSDVLDLVLEYYQKLAPEWRARIPLTKLYVVEDAAGE